jgi:GTP-binding protein
VLLHVLDCATLEPGRDPLSDLDAIEAELAQYVSTSSGTFGDLLSRPRLVALNKVDVPEAADLAQLVRADIEARGLPVYEISAVSHAGLRELTFALAAAVTADRAARPEPEPARIVIRPKAVDDAGFTVVPDPDEPGGYLVRGAKPERWVKQTDFENDEAVGYLADRLARLGVEQRLAELGAQPGDAVTIGAMTFDFEPTAGLGDYLPTRRGFDERLNASGRTSPAERLAAKKARRVRADGDTAGDWPDEDES